MNSFYPTCGFIAVTKWNVVLSLPATREDLLVDQSLSGRVSRCPSQGLCDEEMFDERILRICSSDES